MSNNSKTANSKKKNSESKKLVKWDVIVLDDDHHSYDDVVEILMNVIPRMDQDDAFDITSDIDYAGKGRVWTGSHKVAVFYREQLIDAGLSVDKVRKHKVTEGDKQNAECESNFEEQITPLLIEGLEMAIAGLKGNLGDKKG